MNNTSHQPDIPRKGPDADAMGAETEGDTFNSQRSRDTETAGQRGSNHIGQGAEKEAHAAPTPIRNGNSQQDSFDEKANQNLDMQLDDDIDEELDSIGGTERADYGYSPKRAPDGDAARTGT